MLKNKLYLIPSFLGENSDSDVIPSMVKDFILKNNFFIVEKDKTFRKYIKTLLPQKKQSDFILCEIDKHSDNILTQEIKNFIIDNINNNNIGLVSESGLPCIADPGKDIVYFCHQNNISVVPFIGPSSIFLSLMASGLNGQNFAFNGYLPIDKGDRKSKLLELEKKVFRENQTQIFIETPYRNESIFSDIINYCNSDIKLCIAKDITLNTESIITKKISKWKNTNIDFNKKPSIFLIGN